MKQQAAILHENDSFEGKQVGGGGGDWGSRKTYDYVYVIGSISGRRRANVTCVQEVYFGLLFLFIHLGIFINFIHLLRIHRSTCLNSSVDLFFCKVARAAFFFFFFFTHLCPLLFVH